MLRNAHVFLGGQMLRNAHVFLGGQMLRNAHVFFLCLDIVRIIY